ncbi:MAG: hypothetical protein QOJ27_354 [Sphingomonadales bacterium]|nr:hypothetical protein [Sphingomonadales bacterium]
MPRYFFHIEDGNMVRDDEGTELKDLAVAKCEAVKLAGQMICDSAKDFWENEEWKLTAANEDGLTLFCLHFVGIDAPAANGRPEPEMMSVSQNAALP